MEKFVEKFMIKLTGKLMENERIIYENTHDKINGKIYGEIK